MFNHIQKLSITILSLFIFVFVANADINLPTPQTKEGMGIFEALKRRSSTPGGGFGVGKVSEQELSTILWAASGLNRGKRGWTVPMANGKPPYVRIYVAGENGVFRYEWDGQYLHEISTNDIRSDIGQQAFTKRAAYSLIFVTDSAALADFNDNEKANNFSQIAVGAMSQNIYLAAASLKLNVRYIHSIKSKIMRSELKLADNDQPIGIMLLGK